MLSSAGTIVGADAATTIPNVHFATKYSLCTIEVGTSYKLRWLEERWKWCNTHMFGGQMKPPKFVISRANKTKVMGVWKPGTRELELAHKMFGLKDESHALGTLIHEMAHQYNSEVERTVSMDDLKEDILTKGHGPVWKSIMRRIGQPVDATFTGNSSDLFTREQRKLIEEFDDPNGYKLKVDNNFIQKGTNHFLVLLDRGKATELVVRTTNNVKPSPRHRGQLLVAGFDVSMINETGIFGWYLLESCYQAMPSRVRKDAPELLSPAADLKHEAILRYLTPGPDQSLIRP